MAFENVSTRRMSNDYALSMGDKSLIVTQISIFSDTKLAMIKSSLIDGAIATVGLIEPTGTESPPKPAKNINYRIEPEDIPCQLQQRAGNS
jgi:hypothetical protein